MRIFKNKWFVRFARKEGISDVKLREAVNAAEGGKIDADYGGGVIKQRIARPNEGKSSGYRTIILYRKEDKAFFVYGFAKKDQDNITAEEARAFKDLCGVVFQHTNERLGKLVKEGVYQEVKNENE